MLIPRKHVLFLEFLLPLPIERWNIIFFVPSLIANLEHLLHFEDVNFGSRMNNRHHSAQGNSHRALFFNTILCLSRTSELLNLVWFSMAWIVLPKDKELAYGTTWEIYKKIQNVSNSQKNYESNLEFCKQKCRSNAPKTSCVSIILVMEISLQDMSYKRRHKKVQDFFLKKKLNLESLAKEKKGAKHPRFSLGFSSIPWAPSKLLSAPREVFQEQEKK